MTRQEILEISWVVLCKMVSVPLRMTRLRNLVMVLFLLACWFCPTIILFSAVKVFSVEAGLSEAIVAVGTLVFWVLYHVFCGIFTVEYNKRFPKRDYPHDFFPMLNLAAKIGGYKPVKPPEWQ